MYLIASPWGSYLHACALYMHPPQHVPTSHQRGSCGTAEWLHVVVGKDNAGVRQLAQGRGLDDRVVRDLEIHVVEAQV
jgi:hypothetical protein